MNNYIKKQEGILKNEKDLRVIVNYIEENLNFKIKSVLEALSFLSAKVAEVHWPTHEELILVDNIFEELSLTIKHHLDKKKRYFFSMILGEDIKINNLSILDFIEESKKIHKNYLINLEKIRELTKDYKIPQDACKTYTKLLNNLLELDQILKECMDTEDKILYPLVLSKLKSL